MIAQSPSVGMAGLILRPQVIIVADGKILEPEWQMVIMMSIEFTHLKGCRMVLGFDFPTLGKSPYYRSSSYLFAD